MTFLSRRTLGFLGGLLVGALAVFVFLTHEGLVDSDAYISDEHYWQQRIKAVGAEVAYAEHVGAVEAEAIQLSHTLAHVFGAALYKELGVNAVSVCGNEFAFGCLHEVFERVVGEHGPEGLHDAVAACAGTGDEERWHPCHHALGHGLVAYFGYHDEAVLRALDICHDGFNEDPINGCVGGVFMEFNLYTSIAPTIEPRPLDEHGWYYPCTVIPEQYHRACYFWLPQWWREVMKNEGMSGEDIFAAMGEQCENAPAQSYVRECFERVGQHATYQAKYESDRAKELCDMATDDPLYNFLCRSYSAFSFRYTDERFSGEALAMCSEFTGEQKNFCEQFAENKANIGWAPALPHEFREERI